MSINRITLLGNVGADPEVRDTQGGKFATLRLATTTRGYARKDGSQVPERTEWHSLVVNGGLVQVVESYVRKGTKLYVEGELRYRKYTDRNGQERTAAEISVRDLELCGGKADAGQPAQQQAYSSPYQQTPFPPQQAQGGLLGETPF